MSELDKAIGYLKEYRNDVYKMSHITCNTTTYQAIDTVVSTIEQLRAELDNKNKEINKLKETIEQKHITQEVMLGQIFGQDITIERKNKQIEELMSKNKNLKYKFRAIKNKILEDSKKINYFNIEKVNYIQELLEIIGGKL